MPLLFVFPTEDLCRSCWCLACILKAMTSQCMAGIVHSVIPQRSVVYAAWSGQLVSLIVLVMGGCWWLWLYMEGRGFHL